MTLIIVFSFLIFVLMLGLYAFAEWVSYQNVPIDERGRFLSGKFVAISKEVWSFGRPILRAALLIAIAMSLLSFFNLDIKTLTAGLTWDIRSLLAFLVVGSFCVASIAGSDYSGFLKDVSLVIIGFYFGGLPK